MTELLNYSRQTINNIENRIQLPILKVNKAYKLIKNNTFALSKEVIFDNYYSVYFETESLSKWIKLSKLENTIIIDKLNVNFKFLKKLTPFPAQKTSRLISHSEDRWGITGYFNESFFESLLEMSLKKNYPRICHELFRALKMTKEPMSNIYFIYNELQNITKSNSIKQPTILLKLKQSTQLDCIKLLSKYLLINTVILKIPNMTDLTTSTKYFDAHHRLYNNFSLRQKIKNFKKILKETGGKLPIKFKGDSTCLKSRETQKINITQKWSFNKSIYESTKTIEINKPSRKDFLILYPDISRDFFISEILSKCIKDESDLTEYKPHVKYLDIIYDKFPNFFHNLLDTQLDKESTFKDEYSDTFQKLNIFKNRRFLKKVLKTRYRNKIINKMIQNKTIKINAAINLIDFKINLPDQLLFEVYKIHPKKIKQVMPFSVLEKLIRSGIPIPKQIEHGFFDIEFLIGCNLSQFKTIIQNHLYDKKYRTQYNESLLHFLTYTEQFAKIKFLHGVIGLAGISHKDIEGDSPLSLASELNSEIYSYYKTIMKDNIKGE